MESGKTDFSREQADETVVTDAPLDVTEFTPPPRTITEYVETDAGVLFNDWPMLPNPLRHPLRCVAWLVRTPFSIAVLIAALAVVAAIPVASIFVLGYLLEVEGRIARSGRLRDGFPLLSLAPRIGSIVAGVLLWLTPLFFTAGMAADAALIDPAGPSAARWQTAKIVLGMLIVVHLCLALARGGSFGCFFRPLKNLLWFIGELRNRPIKGRVRCPDCGEPNETSAVHCALCGFTPQECARCGESIVIATDVCAMCGHPSTSPIDCERRIGNLYWHRADRKVRQFVQGFRLKHHFVLGLRGAIGASAILLLPTLMFAAATKAEGPLVLLTVFGGLCLAIAFLYVPFLQARLAAENRGAAMFELRAVRRLYAHAPIAWFLALLAAYAMSLPLILPSAFSPPQDAMWLITLLFVISIYPTRVIAGWAYARAARKQREGKAKAHWVFRHGCRVLMFSTTVAYTLFFFFIATSPQTADRFSSSIIRCWGQR